MVLVVRDDQVHVIGFGVCAGGFPLFLLFGGFFWRGGVFGVICVATVCGWVYCIAVILSWAEGGVGIDGLVSDVVWRGWFVSRWCRSIAVGPCVSWCRVARP